MGECLFISDLHLAPERPATVALFFKFLEQRARHAAQLYILGDFFDAWIGDDDDTAPYPAIAQALRKLTNGGTQVLFQRGNRDFLVGQRFAQAAGCQLLPDVYPLDLYGVPTLLTHGDLLCGADPAYQRLRRQLRNPLFTWLFRLRSLERRRIIATDYRNQSMVANATKPRSYMDVNPDTLATYLRRYQVRQCIHGHIHRAGRYDLLLDGVPVTRWTLANWQTNYAPLLRATAEGLEWTVFPVFK